MGLEVMNSPNSPVPNYAGEEGVSLSQVMENTIDAPGGFTAEDIARFNEESARSFRKTWAARDAAAAEAKSAHAVASREERAEAQIFMLPRRSERKRAESPDSEEQADQEQRSGLANRRAQKSTGKPNSNSAAKKASEPHFVTALQSQTARIQLRTSLGPQTA